MVPLFKEKSATQFFWLILISLGLHIQFLYHPPVVVTTTNAGLIKVVLDFLQNSPSALIILLYYCIIIIQASMLNYILNEAKMFYKPVYTTALAYVLVTALLPEWNSITANLLSNFLILSFIASVFKLHNNNKIKANIYNIGLLTGASVLLYFPLLPLVLVAFLALTSFRPFKANELFIMLLGIITPFYFYAGYLFLKGELTELEKVRNLFQWHTITLNNIPAVIATISFCVLVIIYGAYLVYSNNHRMIIQVRKNWFLLFVMILLFIPNIFIIENSWPFVLLLLAAPAAAYISYSFITSKKNFIPNLIFWVFVALCFYNSWVFIKQ